MSLRAWRPALRSARDPSAEPLVDVKTISSRKNPIVQAFRALAGGQPTGKQRVLLEGAHLLHEARAMGLEIELVAIAERPDEGKHARLADELADVRTRVVRVSKSVMTALSPARVSTGPVAIARFEPPSLTRALDSPPQLVVVGADVQDPGNVGALVRAANAGGATGVVIAGTSADPFGWKALRGAMGSTFRIPVAVHRDLAAVVRTARSKGLEILAAVPRTGRPLYSVDLTTPTAVLFGNEGAGLPRDITRLSDGVISIPMRSGVESLNIAVAAAVVTYEGHRQRDQTRGAGLEMRKRHATGRTVS